MTITAEELARLILKAAFRSLRLAAPLAPGATRENLAFHFAVIDSAEETTEALIAAVLEMIGDAIPRRPSS